MTTRRTRYDEARLREIVAYLFEHFRRPPPDQITLNQHRMIIEADDIRHEHKESKR